MSAQAVRKVNPLLYNPAWFWWVQNVLWPNGTICTGEVQGQQQKSAKNHRFDWEVSALDFQTSCASSLVSCSHYVSCPQRQCGATAQSECLRGSRATWLSVQARERVVQSTDSVITWLTWLNGWMSQNTVCQGIYLRGINIHQPHGPEISSQSANWRVKPLTLVLH